MGRRMCKENYAFNVKFNSPYIIYCRLRSNYYSFNMSNIQAIIIIQLTYIVYYGIIYLTLWVRGTMKIPHEQEAKHQLLNEQNVLYKKADTVTDELFQTLDFFDSHDLIQVKYEMVRRVQKEGWSVTRAAAAFGFSRISYYTIQHALETHGLMGLMPKKRGPKQPTKITDEVLKFIEQLLEQDLALSSQKLQALIATELGVEVHKRTIERALQRKKKPPGITPERFGAGA